MANASLTPIYNRLNAAPKYHPLTAETFADWAMEAGDLVTVSRDGNSYTSPVSTSRMVWRGRQQINIESTGSKERPAISKVSRQKYSGSRGAGSAIANNNYIYNEVGTRARVFVSFTDPALTNEVSEGDFWVKSNETETWNDLSASTWTYSSVFNWNDYKGALVYVRDSKGTWRLVSDQQTLLDHSTRIEQDENHISLIAQDVEKVGDTVYRNYAELKVEQDRISADVVNAYAGLESHITQTASDITSEVRANYQGLSSKITQTASDITAEVRADYEGLSSTITQTASSIRSEVSNSYAGLSSTITQTASSIRSEVSSSYAGLNSKITQTASQIRSEISSSYAGLSSKITQTASQIRSEVSSSYEGLSSTITQTASSIRSEVSSSYQGLSSYIQQTASSFSVEVSKRAKVFIQPIDPAMSGADVSVGDFWVQTHNIETWSEMAATSWTYSSTFDWNSYKGCITWVWTEGGKWRRLSNEQEMLDHTTLLEQDHDHISLIAQDVQRIDGNVYRNYAELKVEQDKISADVVNAYAGLESHIRQTASDITSEVRANYQGLSSKITQTASDITAEVRADYEGLSSTITQTASSIRSEVSSQYDGLSSSITQEKNRIDLVVEKKNGQNVIKAASIMTAINDDTSSVVIEADHINLNGYVKATDLTTQWLKIEIESADLITAKSLQIYNGTTPYGTPNVQNIRALLNSYKVVQDGNNYKLQYKPLNSNAWVDAPDSVTFSRATSLSGAWSGNTYTVTASPQGNTNSTSPVVHTIGSQGSAYMQVCVATPTSGGSGYEDHGNKTTLYLVTSSGSRNVYIKSANSTTSGTVYAQTTISDSNLSAGNIKKNVTIFGVTGTYEGSGGSVTKDDIDIPNEYNQWYPSSYSPMPPYDATLNNLGSKIPANNVGYVYFHVDVKGATKVYRISVDTSG